MSRRKSSGSGGRVLFATIVVIAGVVGVAWLASNNGSLPGIISATSSTLATTSSSTHMDQKPAANVPAFAFVNDDSVTLVNPDGSQTRLTDVAFASQVASSSWPVWGASVANGQPATFPPAAYTSDNVSPDGRVSAKVQSATDQAADTVVFTEHGTTNRVAVRAGGLAVRDLTPVGWLDATTMAVAGTAQGVRSIYAVSTGGTVKSIFVMPATAVWMQAADGYIWYADATPGEGIESPPAPPSNLHRIAKDGTDQLLLTLSSHVIQNAEVSADGSRVAFVRDDGTAAVIATANPSVVTELGRMQPVLLTGDGVLLRSGFAVSYRSFTTGDTTNLGSVPEGGVSAFVLSSTP